MMAASTYSVYITLDNQGQPTLLGDAKLINNRWHIPVEYPGGALINITAIQDLAFRNAEGAPPLTWAGGKNPDCCGWSIVAPAQHAPVTKISINDANGRAEQIRCLLHVENLKPIPLTIANGVG